MSRTRVKVAAAIIALAAIVAAAFLLIGSRAGWYLIISDGTSGEELARYPLQAGEQFAVGFIHSVNLRPLIDVYEISEDHKIYAEETIYYQFGAGVQTEVNAGETMTLGEDGAIIVGNIHQYFETFTCSVGMVSDRTLMLGDIHPDYEMIKEQVGVFTDQLEQQVGDVRIISLSNLCGRKSIVSFSYEYRLF